MKVYCNNSKQPNSLKIVLPCSCVPHSCPPLELENFQSIEPQFQVCLNQHRTISHPALIIERSHTYLFDVNTKV